MGSLSGVKMGVVEHLCHKKKEFLVGLVPPVKGRSQYRANGCGKGTYRGAVFFSKMGCHFSEFGVIFRNLV